MANCDSCGRPILDTAFVCHDEALRLEDQLRQAAELWAELDITITRQDRMAAPGPHRRGRAPAAPIRPDGQQRHYGDQDVGHAAGLPANLAASDAADAIRGTVTTWARHIEAERGEQAPAEPADLMRWVAGKLHWLRYRAEAGEAFDELADAAALVWRTVDRPAERVDAGECWAPLPEGGSCTARLSATRGAAHVRCRTCGASHDAEWRRQLLLKRARDTRGTATEIARWLTLLGLPTPADTVHKWVARRRITADRTGMFAFRDAEKLRLRDHKREGVRA